MLNLKNISFSYSKESFIEDLNLQIEKGSHISLIGSSGCGKSTLLQLIYGLHHVEGTIFWGNKQLLGPNFNLVPGEDFIKYLRQNFDLMPPLTAAENIGKHLSNAYPRKKKRRITELMELVEIQELANVKARNFSGGQQQRVALARVLAKEPELLLLDEPFSHIDHFRKNKLRRNLFSHLKEKGITCIIATHDSTDALSFADETLVMDNGKIIVRGTPEELYKEPRNVYVASLFDEVNQLPLKLFLPNSQSRKKVILYPHEIQLTEKAGLKATVKTSYFKGSNYLVESIIEKNDIFFENPQAIAPGKEIFLKIKDKSRLI